MCSPFSFVLVLFPLVLSFFFSRFVSPWGYSKAVEGVPELGNGQEKGG